MQKKKKKKAKENNMADCVTKEVSLLSYPAGPH